MRAHATAYLLLALTALCWAGNFILGRAMHAEIPPVTFNFWRWVVAAAVLAPFAARDTCRYWTVLRAHWRVLSVLALLGVTLINTLTYTGLNDTTAVNAALIMASLPVVIMVLAFVLYRERVTPRQAAGVALSLAGVAVIILRGEPAALVRLEVAAGDVWIVASAVVWALYSVLLRDLPTGLPPLAFLLAIMVMGITFLAPAYAAEVWIRGGIPPTPENLASIAYVGVFASVIAYIAWNRGVADVGAAQAGHVSHLVPVFTTAFGVALLDEQLHAYHGLGAALIAAGLALATLRAARAPA